MIFSVEVKPSTNLLDQYRQVRHDSERLIEYLTPEDCGLQAMPDVSPPKWHLAHTTWFFETFILKNALPDYRPFHPLFQTLFNSYYNAIGEQFSRPKRHLLSRPSLQEVLEYRQYVDHAMQGLLQDTHFSAQHLVRLGLNHEQQHQELLLMDIKYSFFQNPLYPAMQATEQWQISPPARAHQFVPFDGGLVTTGSDANSAEFCYDNETPAFQSFLKPFQLGSRLITNSEYLQFIKEGGYQTPALWLSDGWSWLNTAAPIHHPLYWVERDGHWFEFTLQGLQPLDPNRAVCHISFYEADAFATWAQARLATEAEWEVAARQQTSCYQHSKHTEGHFANRLQWHPEKEDTQLPLSQLMGEGWEWTQSPYQPYPGFKAPEGAVGEYNGKFMCNQMVLRGGSCLTPAGHIRPTYRNFFYPKDRWPMSVIRLAKDVD